MAKKVIAKVRRNKINDQKTVTIPKEAKHIQEGDYVEVKKVE